MRVLWKRGLASFLSLALTLGLLPAYSFAAESEVIDEPVLSLSVSGSSETGTYLVGETVNVDVSAPSGAQIYYTTDGSEPTEASYKVEGSTIAVVAEQAGTVEVKALAVIEKEAAPEISIVPQPEEFPAESYNPATGGELKNETPEAVEPDSEEPQEPIPGPDVGENDEGGDSKGENVSTDSDETESTETDNGDDEPDVDAAPTTESDEGESGDTSLDAGESDVTEPDGIEAENVAPSDDKAEGDELDNDEGDPLSPTGDVTENSNTDDDTVSLRTGTDISSSDTDGRTGDENTENILEAASLMRFSSVGMSSAMALPVVDITENEVSDENDGQAVKGDNDPSTTVETEKFYASIKLEFVDALNLLSQLDTPVLSTEDDKRIFNINEPAKVNVGNLPEGASAYYVVINPGDEDKTPDNTNGTKIENNEITVTSPNQEDGGAVTVRVVFVSQSGESMAFSEVAELKLSFYDTHEAEQDEMSIRVNDVNYYFSTAGSAFAAVDDANFSESDLLLTVLNESEWSLGTSNKTLSSAKSITLDLAGENFKISTTATSSAKKLTINTSFTLKDSSNEDNLFAEDGISTSDFEQLNLATLALQNVYFSIGGQLNVSDVKIEGSGAKLAYIITINTSEKVCIENTIMGRDSSARAHTSAHVLKISGGCTATVNNSYFYDLTTAGIGININNKGGSTTLENCVVTAPSGAVSASYSTVDIKGGAYSGENSIKTSGDDGVANLHGGTFTGTLDPQNNNSKIIIYSGCFQTVEKASGAYGTVDLSNCSLREIVPEGEYAGYGVYEAKNQHTATIQLTAPEGKATLSPAPGTQTVNENEEVIYTVTCVPGYELSKITYEIGEVTTDISLNENPALSTNEYRTVFSYRMTVPDQGYKLTFTVTASGAVGTEVVSVGEDKYPSLTAAMEALSDNNTITLLEDIVYPGQLIFEKSGVTLDLNGHTLTIITPNGASDPDEFALVVKNGSLTVCDSTGGQGTILFGGGSGIELQAKTGFTLTSGMLDGLGTSDLNYALVLEGTESKAEIKGGTIKGKVAVQGAQSLLKISSGRLEAAVSSSVLLVGNKGTVEMTGGVIYSGSEVERDTASVVFIKGAENDTTSETFKMTGGSIICNNSAYAVQLEGMLTRGVIEFSGDANVVANQNAAIVIVGDYANDAKFSVKISGQNTKIKGATYAIEFQENTKAMPEVLVEGGKFACGESYLPISDTYWVTYPDTDAGDDMPDVVLAVEPDEDGYYGMVDPETLGGEHESQVEGVGVIKYNYQDFDGASDGSGQGLHQLLDETKTIYEDGNSENKYPSTTWNTFISTYKTALRLYESNRNANQLEIDYYTKALSKSWISLTAAENLDPSTLKDGTYKIEVGLWKSNLTVPSMANDALEPVAYLKKEGSTFTLELSFKSVFQYSVYGHLLSLCVYHGEQLSDTYQNMKSDTTDGYDDTISFVGTGSSWYHGTYESADMEYPPKVDGKEPVDEKTDYYSLPSKITVQLPYVGISEEKACYWVGMNVDAMGGYASAILMLSWGTLEEVTTQSTLNISHESLDLLKNEDFKVTAEVLNEEGWSFGWSSSDTNVATVTAGGNGEATIKAGSTEGDATITVTASKDGQEALTRDIIVKVKPGSTRMEGSVTTSGDTAKVTISGDAVVTSSETVSIEADRIVIDATTSNPNSVDSADITFSKASMQALDVENKALTVKTDAGTISLDEDVVAEAAADTSGDLIRLIMKETSIPDIDGLSSGDVEAAYDLELYYGTRRVSNPSGEITIAVPWSDDVGYAYYYNEDTMELDERFSMSNAGDGLYSWTTTHFSTWVLSTDPNLIDLGIKEGVYSVPIRIKQADNTSRDSMANDAVGDMVVADVDEDGVTYTMFLKARIGDELGSEPLRGHLLKMWYYAPDDTSRSNPIRATVVRTYEDRDMNGEIDTFPREVEVYQEGEPNEDYYIQVSVDAMGGDSALQDALVRLDWDNALDDGGEAAREGFEDEYAIEQVIDSGASVSRSDLSDWIDNENILLVQGKDDDLTALFDTDALEDLYDQTSSSIKFVLEEVRTSKLTDEQQETAGDRPVYQLKLTSGGDDITDIGDGNVEVTLPYELDDGEVADGLVIWLLDEDGTHSKIKCSYSERGKTVSFDTTEFGVFVIGYDAEQIWENPFTDVKEDDWFYEAVKYVVQKGLFAGTSETTFEPNLAMTRGMLVTVLYRLEGTPAVTGSSTFADVAPGQYYTSAVIWATQNGIVSGYGNGYFGTNDIVSREQMATILFRYAKSKDYDTSLVKDIGGFTDSDQVASYAKRALQWAYANGIIGGTSETTLSPKGSATRSQVATILMRFDEKIIVPAQEKAAKEAAEAEK